MRSIIRRWSLEVRDEDLGGHHGFFRGYCCLQFDVSFYWVDGKMRPRFVSVPITIPAVWGATLWAASEFLSEGMTGFAQLILASSIGLAVAHIGIVLFARGKCEKCGTTTFGQMYCDPCWNEMLERLREDFEFDLRPPSNEEFVGVSNKEKHATIEARRETVLAECNSKLPVYKPR